MGRRHPAPGPLAGNPRFVEVLARARRAACWQAHCTARADSKAPQGREEIHVRSFDRRLGTLLLLLLAPCASLGAQTIEDGILMPKKALCTGFIYTHDSWDEYWEGTLKRDNGNIGTITTQSVAWMGSYGITNRLNAVAMVPYLWTGASQGVLHGQSGMQDLSLALKYKLLETPFTGAGSLRVILVATGGTPLSDYTPDFLPLSIGLQSSRFSGRSTLYFHTDSGFFVNATGAYTWRGNVTLDRPAYFTDGELHMSDEVQMPDLFDYTVSTGYIKGRWQVPVSFSQQITLGGGDIRRQDMPFVSNRMNFTAAHAELMYFLPGVSGLRLDLGAAHTLSGRNVGQSTTIMTGLTYAFHL
jgi:hypothetical protein